MKKYYAKPTTGEYYNWEDWYSNEQAAEDHFWAGGNRDFGDINGSMIADLKKNIENTDYDIYNGIEDGVTDEEAVAEMFRILYYYFPDAKGKEEQYLKLIDKFQHCKSQDENDVLCEILELETGEPYINGTLHGYSQGDWMDYICPKKLADSIHYIEAVIMGTGTEYFVSDDMLESEEEFYEAIENGECHTEFADLWREEDVKEWIADLYHCKPEEVEVLEAE